MMTNEQKEKRVIIKLPEKRHADFKIRLHYDELTQAAFFRAVTEGYISQDELIIEFVENYKKKEGFSTAYKRRRTQIDKELRDKNIKRFALGEDEIEDIYDLVEKEHPDL